MLYIKCKDASHFKKVKDRIKNEWHIVVHKRSEEHACLLETWQQGTYALLKVSVFFLEDLQGEHLAS